jgi:hypothetical protein
VCGAARGNHGPINQRRLEAQRGLEYVLRIGRVARLGPSSEQVLKKSVTGTARRCEWRRLICWSMRKLAMDLGDSTNEAESCRMLVAKGADPSRAEDCWLPSRRKDNRACMSSAVQPLRGPGGTGTRVRTTRVEGAHDIAGLIGRAEVIAASLITRQKPIITRSGGWVRPETWAIHGSTCDGCCAVHRMDITRLATPRATHIFSSPTAACTLLILLLIAVQPHGVQQHTAAAWGLAPAPARTTVILPPSRAQAFAGRSYPAVGADRWACGTKIAVPEQCVRCALIPRV